MVYYIVSGVLLMFFWCPCMAINVSVQYNGGLLPDIILLTQCYFHRGTRLNAMKKFYICSRDRTHVPTCQKVTWLPLSYRGDRFNLLVQKIRLHGRRGKGTAESFSRGKLRQAAQKERGEILCDPVPV